MRVLIASQFFVPEITAAAALLAVGLLAGCSGESDPATDMTGTTATLNGRISPERSDAFETPTTTRTQTWKCGWGTFTAGNLPSSCWRPFADTSFVNTPLPADPRLLSNSSTIVADLFSPANGDGTVHHLQPIPTVGNDFGNPYYFSARGDPLYTIACQRNCNLAGRNLNGRQVRIPCGAVPADGTDHHLVVIDQVSGLEWDFWNVQTDISSCPGGRLMVGLAGNAPMSGDGRSPCASAVCVALLAGDVRQQELAAGRIDHALMMITDNCNGTTVYPGWEPNTCGGIEPTAPAEGQWFQLNLTLPQIQAIPGIADWQKTILTAMSIYGMYVGDQGSNGAFELQTESPAMYSSMGAPNPWREWAEIEVTTPNNHISYDGSTLSLDLGGGLPTSFWTNNLRVIDPCVIKRTCR